MCKYINCIYDANDTCETWHGPMLNGSGEKKIALM